MYLNGAGDYEAHYNVNFSRNSSPDGLLIEGNISETKMFRDNRSAVECPLGVMGCYCFGGALVRGVP